MGRCGLPADRWPALTYSYLGKFGEGTADSGVSPLITSITIPITTAMPVSTVTDTITAVIFFICGPGTDTASFGRDITIYDDALTDDSLLYGTRWSPYNQGDPTATTTDPPDFGPPNGWWPDGVDLAGISQPPHATFQTLAFGAMIVAAPNNITIQFSRGAHSSPQNFVHAVVYVFSGLGYETFDDVTPRFLHGNDVSFAAFGDTPLGPFTISPPFGPGWVWGAVTQHEPFGDLLSATVATGEGLLFPDILLETPTGPNFNAGFGFLELPISGYFQYKVEWGPEHPVAASLAAGLSGVAVIGDGLVAPDALSITITTSFVLVGSTRRYTVTIVDSAHIPSNTTDHMITPFWRIVNAPDPSTDGFDGKWTTNASDLASNGRYVARNAYDSGFYIPVPPNSVYQFRAFLYDGLISNEVTVALPGEGFGGQWLESTGGEWVPITYTPGALYESDGVQQVRIGDGLSGALFESDGKEWVQIA